MTASLLDAVPGLGESKRKALLKHFGSVKKLRAAEVPEITAVKGIGPVLGQAVYDALQSAESEPAVNMTTGEILES
ncbi:hypothetical protein LJD49_29700, partial [Escherichia coli]|nr:hypothetical protein [Escherichia coli]